MQKSRKGKLPLEWEEEKVDGICGEVYNNHFFLQQIGLQSSPKETVLLSAPWISVHSERNKGSSAEIQLFPSTHPNQSNSQDISASFSSKANSPRPFSSTLFLADSSRLKWSGNWGSLWLVRYRLFAAKTAFLASAAAREVLVIAAATTTKEFHFAGMVDASSFVLEQVFGWSFLDVKVFTLDTLKRLPISLSKRLSQIILQRIVFSDKSCLHI